MPVEQLTEHALGRLAIEIAAKIEALGPANCHALIACTKRKGTFRAPARDMYLASALYRKSILVADSWGVPYSILSAKHGLLDPNEIIDPYELTLKGKNQEFKREWAKRVHAQLESSIAQDKHLVLFAGADYSLPLVELDLPYAARFIAPMQSLSMGHRLAFLKTCLRIYERKRAITGVYSSFESLVPHIGFHRLRDLLDETLPKQGVYFFFDDNENTKFSKVLPRLVRIGTHGVSAGSTATLRTRLRTHFGTKSGRGNHRASVFRLHVGRAFIERDRLHERYPNWGKGQSASKDVTEQEESLEAQVSEYIGSLRVLYVPVHGVAGTSSMRATIERQLISLFTENMNVCEPSSDGWLGRYSDKKSIEESGLWNVRDVGGKHDIRFARLFENLIKKNPFGEQMPRAD